MSIVNKTKHAPSKFHDHGSLSKLIQGRLAIFLLFCTGLSLSVITQAQDILAPAGSSGAFGETVKVLPNGNFLVTDPFYNSGVGAVYLYRPNRTLISRVTGTSIDDQVGRGGVTVLPNSNVVVASPRWRNGTATEAGAVTWINGSTGLSGVIGAANSLVGTSTGDRIGSGGIDLLTNGNYVVASLSWDNGSVVDAGAATWGSATQGVSGSVSSQNSLVGSTAGDRVTNGSNGVIPLPNGHYVVSSVAWDNGLVSDVGAMTWGNGITGISGVVSASNSLIGATADDRIGSIQAFSNAAITLSNGNYVVPSTSWDNGAVVNAGAVTWCNGSAATIGVVSTSNSLVGSNTNDRVGELVTPLTNGNYVVASRAWDNGAFTNAGAVTWRNGTAPFAAVVSPTNSLVGIRSNQFVGSSQGFNSYAALSNGNFVLLVAGVDAAATIDAVIWVNGAVGATGPVSAQSGLTGSVDELGGGGIHALTNGNYVVCSSSWTNGAMLRAGAATWGNGLTGSSGVISPANSLVGSMTDNRVCGFGVVALSNGNYVIASSKWDNGALIDVGAITWANGNSATAGVVSPANSIVGTSPGDEIGETGVISALNDGNYVFGARLWDNGAIVDAGAITWGNGVTGTTGTISVLNSLVGTTANGRVGGFIVALPGGRFSVRSSGASSNDSMATLGGANGTPVGLISPANSIPGWISGGVNPGDIAASIAWDPARERLAVGRGTAVSFISYETISFDGFE